MNDIVSPAQLETAGKIRSILATYKGVEDLLSIGAYVKGSNPKVDQALQSLDDVQGFMRQKRDEDSSWSDMTEKLKKLAI
jgi:flagellum-specific ATP synthase